MKPDRSVGRQPSRRRVDAPDADRSAATAKASPPKCSAMASGGSDVTGSFKPRPIVSAISRRVTPSSTTAWYAAPAASASSASR